MDTRMYPGGVTIAEVTVDLADTGANTTADTAVTVPGIVNGKSAVVFMNQSEALTAGLAVGGVRVTADNQITIRTINTTAAAINQAASTWVIGITKYKS